MIYSRKDMDLFCKTCVKRPLKKKEDKTKILMTKFNGSIMRSNVLLNENGHFTQVLLWFYFEKDGN